MITVRIYTHKDLTVLQVVGHAGAGKRGSDLVCAAASVLTYTAAAAARQLHREGKLEKAPRIRLEPGFALLTVQTLPAAGSMLEVIATGFDLLAAQYPQNVRLLRA